jgi:hypothetical protein
VNHSFDAINSTGDIYNDMEGAQLRKRKPGKRVGFRDTASRGCVAATINLMESSPFSHNGLMNSSYHALGFALAEGFHPFSIVM